MRPSAFVLALGLGLAHAGATTGAALAQPADEHPAYGPELDGFEYPWPVSYYSLTSCLSQGAAGRLTEVAGGAKGAPP
jgi:hypothetical protein